MGLLTFGIILILLAGLNYLESQKPKNIRSKLFYQIVGLFAFLTGCQMIMDYGQSKAPTKEKAWENVQSVQKQYLEAQKLYMEWR